MNTIESMWLLGIHAFWWFFGAGLLIWAYAWSVSRAKEAVAGEQARRRGKFRIPQWLGFCLFLAIALFFLWDEHRAHILGSAPFALLLLCPVIHLLMHRDHGHGASNPTHQDHGEGP